MTGYANAGSCRKSPKESGIPVSTLSAELRPNHSLAKLGADSLVPLFKTIRDLGYGNELKGILLTYFADLQGEDKKTQINPDLVPILLDLYSYLGILSQDIRHIHRLKDDDELCEMEVTIRTEIIPRFLTVLKAIEQRREELENMPKKKGLQKPIKSNHRNGKSPIIFPPQSENSTSLKTNL